MAKFVEFVGLPGVGKTTTYDFLRSNCKGAKFSFLEDLQKENSFMQVLNRKSKTLFYNLINRKGQNTTFDFYREEDLMNRFVQENAQLNKLFWQSVTSNKFYGKDSRFHVVSYMKKVIEKVQRIKEEPSNRIFVVDEGIIHNLNYFTRHTSTSNHQQQLLNILKSTDLPEGIVFFGGDPETIVERTLNRRKILGRDMGLSFDELLKSRKESMEAWKECMDLVEEREVPCLYLDAELEVGEKARKIEAFLAFLSA